MKKRLLPAVAAVFVLPLFASAGLKEARMPVPESLVGQAPQEVSGRQGWKRDQVIRFGPYATSPIERSWTKGMDGSLARLRGEGRKQDIAFTLREGDTDVAAVSCRARVGTLGLSVGGAELNAKDRGKLRCTIEPPGGPGWSLTLEEWWEKPLSGSLAREGEALAVAGSNRLEGTKLRSGVTTGFEILAEGTAIAAVQTLNDGTVWTAREIPESRRAAVAGALAALLALEDLRNLPGDE